MSAAKHPENSDDHYKLLNFTAEANSNFVRSLEQWLMASIQSNYGKTDEEVIRIIVDKCKTMLQANISYHGEVAKLQVEDEPIVARQHRLLAHIYRSLIENHVRS